MNSAREWMHLASEAIQALAVTIMLFFILIGTVRWLVYTRQRVADAYQHYRVMLGKSLLIGLELLVAADIIETAAVDMTSLNLETLGALVVLRTALSWSLIVEVEGRWPWQSKVQVEQA